MHISIYILIDIESYSRIAICGILDLGKISVSGTDIVTHFRFQNLQNLLHISKLKKKKQKKYCDVAKTTKRYWKIFFFVLSFDILGTK